MSKSYARISYQPSKIYRMRYRNPNDFRTTPIYNEERNNKGAQSIFPRVELVNAEGPGLLICFAVSHSEPYHIAPVKLLGTNCNENGIAILKIKSGEKFVDLKNVSLLQPKRKEREDNIRLLKNRENNINTCEFGFKNFERFGGFDCDMKKFDLSKIRLCFQIYLFGKSTPFATIISNKINNLTAKKQIHHRLSNLDSSLSDNQNLCSSITVSHESQKFDFVCTPERLDKFNVPTNDIIMGNPGNSTSKKHSDFDSSDESNLPSMDPSFLFGDYTSNTNQSNIQCEKISCDIDGQKIEKKDLVEASLSNNFDQKYLQEAFKVVRSNQLEIDQSHFFYNNQLYFNIDQPKLSTANEKNSNEIDDKKTCNLNVPEGLLKETFTPSQKSPQYTLNEREFKVVGLYDSNKILINDQKQLREEEIDLYLSNICDLGKNKCFYIESVYRRKIQNGSKLNILVPFDILVFPIFQNESCSLIILDWRNKKNYIFDQSLNITEDSVMKLIDSFDLNLFDEFNRDLVKRNTHKFSDYYANYELSSDVYICMCLKAFLSETQVEFNVNNIDFERENLRLTSQSHLSRAKTPKYISMREELYPIMRFDCSFRNKDILALEPNQCLNNNIRLFN